MSIRLNLFLIRATIVAIAIVAFCEAYAFNTRFIRAEAVDAGVGEWKLGRLGYPTFVYKTNTPTIYFNIPRNQRNWQ